MYSAYTASYALRSLVRTLDFSEIYRINIGKVRKDPVDERCEGAVFNGAWVMHCVRLFPNLQFAIIDTLPYDTITAGPDPLGVMARRAQIARKPDYATNKAGPSTASSSVVCGASTGEVRKLQVEPAKMRPILFSADHCKNAGRCTLLNDMDTSNLVYLDLSDTKRDSGFSTLPRLLVPNLRVLKLRRIRLVDSELFRMPQIEGKLWCLDVRDNFLTDAIIEHLLAHFLSGRMQLHGRPTVMLPDQDLFDDVPEYHRDDDGERHNTTTQNRPHFEYEFKDYVEKHGSFPSINEQFLDANDPLLRQTGLTHLYISKNKLTSRGVKTLLIQSNRLQVLDVGSVEATSSKNSRKFYVPYTTAYAQVNSKVVRSLARESLSRMESLRIHHSFVTYVPTIINAGSRNNGFTLPLVQEAEIFGVSQMLTGRVKPGHKAFSPLQNYRVTTLTLTDIPTKSYGLTAQRLIEFLGECRVQEEKLEEAKRWTKKNRRAPELLPGLRTLQLEFLPEDISSQSPTGGSVSGDRDADNFLASSEGDFSFFSDPNTMSSVSRRGSVVSIGSSGTVTGPTTPASRTGSFVGGSMLKRTVSGFGSRPASSGSAPPQLPPAYTAEVKDVVEELKKFRAGNAKKWTGKLKLVVPSSR